MRGGREVVALGPRTPAGAARRHAQERSEYLQKGRTVPRAEPDCVSVQDPSTQRKIGYEHAPAEVAKPHRLQHPTPFLGVLSSTGRESLGRLEHFARANPW